MIAGLASPQASPSGANNRLEDGDPSHQLTSEQPNRPSEPQSTQPPSSQSQSSQPQSSLPVARQESGDTEQQEGADSLAGSAFTGPGSAQDKSAQGRALPGQAVSSEELTSSEEGLQGQKGLLQSVEGSRSGDKGADTGRPSSSSGMSTSVEQDAGSGEEQSAASGRGQNTDEAEDTTTRMLESAGKLFLIWSSQYTQATDWISDHGGSKCILLLAGF